MDVQAFMQAVLAQDASAMAEFFAPDAVVRWHCSNEQFTVPEYIRANCEYPGDWDGEIEQMVQIGSRIITATHVHTRDGGLHFHAASFFTLNENGLVTELDEYWGDDGPAPQWRQDLHIGQPIK